MGLVQEGRVLEGLGELVFDARLVGQPAEPHRRPYPKRVGQLHPGGPTLRAGARQRAAASRAEVKASPAGAYALQAEDRLARLESVVVPVPYAV